MKKRLILLAMLIMLVTGCSAENVPPNGQGTPTRGDGALAAAPADAGDTAEDTEIRPANEPENETDAPPEAAKSPESSGAASENSGEAKQQPDKEDNPLKMEITVNGRAFSAALSENETAKEFKKRLPLMLDMSELNGNEKYYYLSESLPADAGRPSEIHTGDIMLYGDSCLVIFYEDFSTTYSYTPIGKIDDPAGLAEALGSGSVRITLQ